MFYYFFSLNRSFNVLVNFEVNQQVDVIGLCKSFYDIALMFVHSFYEIVCYTDISCAIFLARKDVYKVLHEEKYRKEAVNKIDK